MNLNKLVYFQIVKYLSLHRLRLHHFCLVLHFGRVFRLVQLVLGVLAGLVYR